MNRSDLLAAITNFFKGRSDLAAHADTFIELSEAYLNHELRCRQMERIETLTPTDSVCTLPDDFIEAKRVVELASIRRPLEFITEEAADHLYPTRTGGLACHYTIVGDELTALPLSSNDIELVYYRTIPALTEASPTNWLLERFPNIYLHCCLMYAAEFTKDTDEMAKEGLLLQRYIGMLQATDTRGTFATSGVTLSGPVW